MVEPTPQNHARILATRSPQHTTTYIMARTALVQHSASITTVQKSEAALGELSTLLAALREAPGISEETRNRLSNLGFELGRTDLGKTLSRALDELDAVPRSRVDTDRLAVSHGAIICFDVWKSLKADGVVPERHGRNTGDDFRLIERFMKDHRGLQIDLHRVPFGSSAEYFKITGTKGRREKLENDPRWPKLLKALGDIYLTDHAPTSSGEKARKREIKDAMKFVFGS
jgi:hypothetical protein